MNLLNKRATKLEHWRAFGPEWFQRHQALLLWGLNTPGLSTLVRGLLRIKMRDVWMPHGTKIWEIRPNCYTVRLPDGSFRTDFRTHWKYSKRVYYAWKLLWWLMHRWDTAFADKWAPAYSFGFLTLTAYPDPDPETVTVDGWMQRGSVDETWATIIAGAGVTAGPSDSLGVGFFRFIASATASQWAFFSRAIFLFDTSALGAGADISAGVLSLEGTSKLDGNAATPNIDIYTSTPATNTNLVAADFSQLGAVSQATPITYANWLTTPAYNDFTLNATGRGNINKTGVTKFGSRNANYDVAASAPPYVASANSNLTGSFADAVGTASDPKLVVTYTSGGLTKGGSSMTTLGVG